MLGLGGRPWGMEYTGSWVRIALLSLLAVQVRAGGAIAQECPAVGATVLG